MPLWKMEDVEDVFRTSLYGLEFIAFALEEADGGGEGVLQVAIVPRFQGIVEGDDGASAGVLHHIGEHLWTSELLAIVACDDIPHHYLVVVAQHDVLLPPHPAVGWTEQAGLQHLIGEVGIGQVAAAGMSASADVVEGMVAYGVPIVHHHLEDFRILTHIVAHHEEGGLDALMFQQAEHPRCDQRDGAVVEREIDGLLLRIDAPKCLWIQAAE